MRVLIKLSALFMTLFFYSVAMAQIPNFCPDLQKRNNGNGQYSTCASVGGVPVASNVVGTSYANVLTTNSINPSTKTGDLNFKWLGSYSQMPVITRLWVGTSLLTTVVGPPPVPTISGGYTYARYCFYVTNIPNNGVLTIEMTNPATGTPSSLCSYDLQSGAATSTPAITCSPTIITQPANKTVCGSNSTFIGLLATGASAYAWQYQTPSGSTWTAANLVADFTTTNDDTIRIANATLYSGYKFRCVLSNANSSCGNSISNTAILTANPLPTAGFAAGAYICGLGSRNLQIDLTGTAPWSITYETTPISGSPSTTTISGVSSSPTFLNVSPLVTTSYSILSVSDNLCVNNSISGTVVITVRALPTLTVSSSNLKTCVGDKQISLSYSTSNTPNRYSITAGNRAMPGFAAVSNQILSTTSGTLQINLPNNLLPGTYDFNMSVKDDASSCASSNVPFTITVNSKPNVNATASASNVCGGTAITLSAAPSNLSTYVWTSSPASSTKTGSSVIDTVFVAKTYTVIATDANACKDTAMVSVSTYSSGSISVSGANICPGFATTLNATGASTYTWSPSTGLSATTGSSVIANPNSTTTYTILGTFSNGCRASTTATVTVGSTATANISASSSSLCYGSSATLTASLSSGTADSVKWYPSTGLSATTGNSVVATPTATTTYSIQAYLAGCIINASKTITVVASPVSSKTGRYLYYCQKETSATISLTTTDSSTFSWYTCTSSGATCNTALTTTTGYTVSPASTSTKAKTSSVVITSVNGINNSIQFYKVNISTSGCTFTEYVDLVQLGQAGTRYNIVADQTICSGTSPNTLTLNGSFNGSYNPQWKKSSSSTTGFGPISGATSVTYSPSSLSSTTYYRLYIPSFGSNVCNSADSSNVVTVTVITALGGNTISVANACSSSAPSITGSTPTGGSTYTYKWESAPDVAGVAGTWTELPAGTNKNYEGSTPVSTKTWYRRTVYSGTCSNTSAAISLYPPISGNEVSSSQTLCAGTSATTLTASSVSGGNGTYTYVWQSASDVSGHPGSWSNISGATSATYSPGVIASTTWYRRTVNSGSCTQTSNEISVVVNALPTVTVSAAASQICSGSSTVLTASGANSYTWSSSPSNSSLSASSGNPVTVNPLANTTYTVVGTSSAGCTASANVLVGVNALPSKPSITAQSVSVCNPISGSYDLNLLVSGVPPLGVSYNWYTVASNPSAPYVISPSTVTNSGTYYVYAQTNSTGCYSVHDSVIVDIKNVVAPSPLSYNVSLCDPSRADLSNILPAPVNGISYEWHTAAAGPSSGNLVSNPTSVGNLSTTETYYLYAVEGSCYSVASSPVTVVINGLPTAGLSTNNANYCAPGSVDISPAIVAPNATYSYSWYTDAVNPSPANLVSNTAAVTADWYYLFVSDTNGCKSQVIDSIQVVESAMPTATATAPSMICYGSSVNIPASSTGTGLNLQWYAFDPSNSTSSSLSNAGVYSGVNTNNLSISNTAGQAKYLFYLNADNGVCAAQSNYVSVPVDTFVMVTVSPVDQTAMCSNCISVFSASSSVQNANLAWQVKNNSGVWRNIGTTGADALMYSGVNTPDLQLLSTQDSMNGFQYRFIADNLCNSDTSSIATLFSLFALPIQFVQFEAKKVAEQQVDLKWTLSGSDAVKYCEVWASVDGVKYQVITRVNGGELNNNLLVFQARDIAFNTSVKYYQVKAILNNGLALKSNTLQVSQVSKQININVSPNPLKINGQTALQIMCQEGFVGQVVLSDCTGKIIYQGEVNWEQGLHSLDWQKELANAGLYNLQFIGEDQRVQQSIKLILINE